jgi:hypothetical protein
MESTMARKRVRGAGEKVTGAVRSWVKETIGKVTGDEKAGTGSVRRERRAGRPSVRVLAEARGKGAARKRHK